MPRHHDLLRAIRQRAGVEAALLVGRDGLVIDGDTSPGFAAEEAAARLPGVSGAIDRVGGATGLGGLVTAVIECERGYAIVSALGDQVLLLVVASREAELAPLLFEIRRFRAPMAAAI